MDGDALDASEEFNDSITRLGGAFRGFRNQALLPLIKPLTAFILRLKDFVKTIKASDVIKNFIVGVKLAAVAIASGLTVAVIANSAAVMTAVGWYGALGVASVLAAAKAAAAWVAAIAPLALAAAGVAFLILMFQDLMVFFRGGDSLIGRVIDGWKQMFSGFGDFIKSFGAWIGHLMLSSLRFAIELMPGGKFIAGKLFDGGAESPGVAAVQSVGAASRARQTTNQFRANFTVNAAPSQNPQEVAGAVREQMEQFHVDRLREAEAGTQ
jgi:hypothetical protein